MARTSRLPSNVSDAPKGTPANPIITKRKDPTEVNYVFTAEQGEITPLLPANLADPSMFRQSWNPMDLRARFEKARKLAETDSDFFGGLTHTKMSYFAAGFCTLNANPAVQQWVKQVRAAGMNLRKFSSDVWWEFLVCDNAVAFWRKQDEGLPLVAILDCEVCDYRDNFGVPSLKVKPDKQKLSPEQIEVLGSRWSNAILKGQWLEVDPSKGEHFRVLSRNKVGKGFMPPRVTQILCKLGTLDLLDVADWGGAWEMGDVVNLIRKGHEIKQGEKAGDPRHFLTKRQSKAILDNTKNKRGPRRVVANFDVSIDWRFLDPKFFDEKKFDGTMKRLMLWGGAAAVMYREGVPNPNVMDAFQKEGEFDREQVSEFIEDVINDPNFYGDLKPPEFVEVGFDPQIWLNQKMMLEWVRAGVGHGLVSPQTGRQAMGVNEEKESAKMLEAHKDPKKYTPAFEAKQGMAGKGDGQGGRPSENPAAQTPAPSPSNADNPGGHLF